MNDHRQSSEEIDEVFTGEKDAGGLMSNLSHARDEIVSIPSIINDFALFYASDNNIM
jgi:hypothetical protein